MIILYLLAVMFLILSILFFNGKGKNLISGYNTMSEQEKSHYDEKRLCKAMGILSLFISILLFFLATLGIMVDSGHLEKNYMLIFAVFFIVSVLVSVIVTVAYVNKNAKK